MSPEGIYAHQFDPHGQEVGRELEKQRKKQRKNTDTIMVK
jgi:hypothetical protein